MLVWGILVLIILILCYFYFRNEQFNIAKDPFNEYVPQNMSFTEFKSINQWDYPGYLDVQAGKEKFGNVYPGGRETVNCYDNLSGCGNDLLMPYLNRNSFGLGMVDPELDLPIWT